MSPKPSSSRYSALSLTRWRTGKSIFLPPSYVAWYQVPHLLPRIDWVFWRLSPSFCWNAINSLAREKTCEDWVFLVCYFSYARAGLSHPRVGRKIERFLCRLAGKDFLLAFYVFILSKSTFEMCHCWFIINLCIVFAFKVPQSTLDSAIDPGYISRQWNGRKHGGVAQSRSSFVAHVQEDGCSQATRTLCLSSLVFERSKLKYNCAKARALISQHARNHLPVRCLLTLFCFHFFSTLNERFLKSQCYEINGSRAACNRRGLDVLGRFAKHSSWSRTRLSPRATLSFFRA